MAAGKYAVCLEADNLIRLECWAQSGLTDQQLAAEIGCSADEIVEWVNAYKFPPKPTVRTSKPITVAGEPVHSHRQLSAQFMAWKRAKDGAMRTRVNK